MNQFFSIIPPCFLSNGENFIWSFFQDRIIRYFETALSGTGMKFVSSENSRITWKLSESSEEINKILCLGALENYAVRLVFITKIIRVKIYETSERITSNSDNRMKPCSFPRRKNTILTPRYRKKREASLFPIFSPFTPDELKPIKDPYQICRGGILKGEFLPRYWTPISAIWRRRAAPRNFIGQRFMGNENWRKRARVGDAAAWFFKRNRKMRRGPMLYDRLNRDLRVTCSRFNAASPIPLMRIDSVYARFRGMRLTYKQMIRLTRIERSFNQLSLFMMIHLFVLSFVSIIIIILVVIVLIGGTSKWRLEARYVFIKSRN